MSLGSKFMIDQKKSLPILALVQQTKSMFGTLLVKDGLHQKNTLTYILIAWDVLWLELHISRMILVINVLYQITSIVLILISLSFWCLIYLLRKWVSNASTLHLAKLLITTTRTSSHKMDTNSISAGKKTTPSNSGITAITTSFSLWSTKVDWASSQVVPKK